MNLVAERLAAEVEAATRAALSRHIASYIKCPELHDVLYDAVMRAAISHVLLRRDGVVIKASADLGLGRNTFQKLMRKYGIERPSTLY